MAKKTVIGAETLARNIIKYTEGFIREVNVDMQKAEIILTKKIRENISNVDHSLADLRRLDHPYSIRNPQSIHKPDYIVHRQSGQMLEGLKSGTKTAKVRSTRLEAEAFAGIEESVEHAKYVIFGTSKMVPRDFLRGSLDEVGPVILKTLKRSLNQVTISFRGKEVRP